MSIKHPIRVIGIQDGEHMFLDDCDIVFAGTRHLAQVTTNATKTPWTHPFSDNRHTLHQQREHGQKISVLASGDPLCFGVGETLIDWFGKEAVQVEPSLSTFSLACAAMTWQQKNVALVTAHGRKLTDLQPALYHGAKLIILGEADTAARLSPMLISMGLKNSKIKALSHLCSAKETIVNHPLTSLATYPSLTCYAVECHSDGSCKNWALGPGLADALFDHDGTMTKRDVRAITLSKLAPRNGQVFWDIGTGNGSIAIEWARLAPRSKAYGIDHRPERLEKAQHNGVRLSGPNHIIWALGKAPLDIPANWEAPDAIFVGGGVGSESLLEALWKRLTIGGRLVANAVTLEGEKTLLAFRGQFGGELTRISIAKEEEIGSQRGWKSSMPILQYEGHKLT